MAVFEDHMDRVRVALNRRNAIRRLFLGDNNQLKPDAEIFFADMARFCRLNRSIMVVHNGRTDIPATFNAEGRREALQRILGPLHMSDADLMRITEVIE
jgi:hypothetical protein